LGLGAFNGTDAWTSTSETVLGKEHPSTLASMSNLALVPRDHGKYFPLLVTTKIGQ
jgi:hypothetical protein